MISRDFDLWHRRNPSAYGIKRLTVASYIQDPTWLKAVFYRDPIARFISAFLSKCGGKDLDGARICWRVFGSKTASFHQAISRVLYKSINNSTFHDGHFARQSDFCGGLAHTLHYYNAVHLLEPQSSRQQLIAILNNASIPLTDAVQRKLDLFFPELSGNQTGEFTVPATHLGAEHFTHSSETKTQLKYLSDDCYTRILVDYYAQDYRVFGIRYPLHVERALGNTTTEACRRKLQEEDTQQWTREDPDTTSRWWIGNLDDQLP